MVAFSTGDSASARVCLEIISPANHTPSRTQNFTDSLLTWWASEWLKRWEATSLLPLKWRTFFDRMAACEAFGEMYSTVRPIQEVLTDPSYAGPISVSYPLTATRCEPLTRKLASLF